MPPIIRLPTQCLRRIHIQRCSPSSIRQLHQIPSQLRATAQCKTPIPYPRMPVHTIKAASLTSQSHLFSTTSSRRQDDSGKSEGISNIDSIVDELQEMYATARDEFEIAFEETEKNTTYAADDRAAAREELDKLLAYYKQLLEGEDKAVAEEVKRRVGQRVRELEGGVNALEELAMNQD